jgi:transposase-like protein
MAIKEWIDRQERAERRRKMAEEVKGGATLAEAAAKFGMSSAVARRACRDHGVEIPKTERQPVPRTMQILAALLYTKKGFARIAREFGVTRQRVEAISKAAAANGIKVPPRRRSSRSR